MKEYLCRHNNQYNWLDDIGAEKIKSGLKINCEDILHCKNPLESLDYCFNKCEFNNNVLISKDDLIIIEQKLDFKGRLNVEE